MSPAKSKEKSIQPQVEDLSYEEALEIEKQIGGIPEIETSALESYLKTSKKNNILTSFQLIELNNSYYAYNLRDSIRLYCKRKQHW
jgi:hypothetical protein